MKRKEIKEILNLYKEGKLDEEKTIESIEKMGYGDLNYAKIDHDRERRNGYPEVIYCEGKSLENILGIVKHMDEIGHVNILGTRADRKVYEEIKKYTEDLVYYEESRIILVNPRKIEKSGGKILVVSGGTADIPVAEEAAIVAEIFGNHVERLYDVGVAGLHRLLSNLDLIREARVVISVAGMEGALTSVVAGLVDVPVIGLPTSVGYGSSFQGVTALLSMLNSCASGVGVVNIDNGFGAAYLASMINKL